MNGFVMTLVPGLGGWVGGVRRAWPDGFACSVAGLIEYLIDATHPYMLPCFWCPWQTLGYPDATDDEKVNLGKLVLEGR